MARGKPVILFLTFIVVGLQIRIIVQVQGKGRLVIIGGDLAESGVPLQRIKENILKLKKLGPIFFVWGNNDHEVDRSTIRCDAL